MFKNIFIYFLFLIMLFSCSGNDCLKSKGEIKTETREVLFFKKIEVNDLFNLYLVNDTINKIEIETNENITGNIITDVVDSVLTINNKTKCRFLKGYNNFPKITIHIKELDAIFFNEPCNLYTIDTFEMKRLLLRYKSTAGYAEIKIKSNHFFIELWGTSTGEYNISGETTFFTTSSNGNSIIKAQDFYSKYTTVINNSTGNYYINCSNKLKGEIKSSGDIILYGNPGVINVIEESTGKLILK